MIINKKLNTIGFGWNDDTQELTISTPIITKRNFFPLLRFMVRIKQRMWGRRIEKKRKGVISNG